MQHSLRQLALVGKKVMHNQKPHHFQFIHFACDQPVVSEEKHQFRIRLIMQHTKMGRS